MPEVRVLGPGDEVILDHFLARHADSSMFLRSNVRAAGLRDHGEPGQATYVAACEGGEVVGVAAHCWNGTILTQAPTHVALLVHEAARRSRRTVSRFPGPWAQVAAAREALGLSAAAALKAGREDLYALDLGDLVVPPALTSGPLRCRRADRAELEQLVAWRASFCVEALGATDGPELRRASRADLELLHARGANWVLLADGELVAFAAFNAMLPEIVQIGGVWTPPALRGRGYGRCVVAGSLVAARRRHVRRAVLFADPRNRAARQAYVALGFRIVGDHGLVLLAGG